MPTLPTLTVSQSHYDRIVAAFPGATPTDKAVAYQAWLTNNLIDLVESVEAAKIDAQAQAARRAALDALIASLPPRQPFPPLVTTATLLDP